MSGPVRERLSYRGFDLRVANGFSAAEAREIVDRALARGGDRVAFVTARPGALGGVPRVFVKAEFRRPDQPLAKRLRASRAVREGRGYRAFAAAGLPVPRLFVFGEQSRLRPRAGAVVVTEKVRGKDAARRFKRERDGALLVSVAQIVARIHAAGFVHGDAVLRNFLVVPGGEYVIDLPGWDRLTPERAERDLALCVGSAMKLGAAEGDVTRLLDAHDAVNPGAAWLREGWRERVVRDADAYSRYLIERDATRSERHARKLVTRASERTATDVDGDVDGDEDGDVDGRSNG